MRTLTIIHPGHQKPFDGLVTSIPQALERARQREGYCSSMPAPKSGSKYAKTSHTQHAEGNRADLRSSSINPKRWAN